jgi:hypothetical protein
MVLGLAHDKFPDAIELNQMAARFAPTPLSADTSGLSTGGQKALAKLIQAARLFDPLFMEQLWSANLQLARTLQIATGALDRARFHLFSIYKGPWDELNEHRAFLPDVPDRKPLGANFYPEDMSRQEFERWVETLPRAKADAARGFFTVIRRDSATRMLYTVPYSSVYRNYLEPAAKLLKQASADAENESLKKFLSLRADALLTDDYYPSDLAWMDLDSAIDITIGPYETYNDELFGYKAAFEVYVCLKDEEETAKLQRFSTHLQEIEDHLPIEARFRNPKLGASMPIRVVNELFSAGDGNHGVQTAAYNLPNDERVIQQKGSKKVMLKNVQHAKFDRTLLPISELILPSANQGDLSFDLFFTHILAHELSHGIGPHEVRLCARTTSVRLELKDLYSTVEEAKADITGLWMLQYFLDNGILAGGEPTQRRLYTTFLASAFRTIRFGIADAHGRGMLLQMNYLLDRGAFIARPDGRFEVDHSKVKTVIRSLTHDLLTIEAEGDYAAAKRMIDELGVIRPPVRAALERMNQIPIDIQPIFVTANQLAPPSDSLR